MLSVRVPPVELNISAFPPVLRNWVIKGLGMSSRRLCDWAYKRSRATYRKEKRLSPGGRFPPSFIHQVIIITGLNKLQLYVLALKMALDADRAAQNPHSKKKKKILSMYCTSQIIPLHTKVLHVIMLHFIYYTHHTIPLILNLIYYTL